LNVVYIDPGIPPSQIGSWAIDTIEINPPMHGIHTDLPSGSAAGGRKLPLGLTLIKAVTPASFTPTKSL